MKMITVTDERGNKLAPTYPKRAKYLIKHGRAMAAGEDAIVLLTTPRNVDIKQYEPDFLDYLTEKKRAQKTIDDFMQQFDEFCNIPPVPELIGEFAWRKGGVTHVKPTYSFLDEFVNFCKEHNEEVELALFADAIRVHIFDYFEGEAWKAVTKYKHAIVPIPKETQIDPQCLNGLTNEQYVTAFGELQQLIYGFYEAIEQGSPFDWGWPDWRGLTVYGIDHNRVMRTLLALSDSELKNNGLIIEKKTFYCYDFNKPQVNVNMLLNRMSENGLIIEGLNDKKSKTFTVSYPNNPDVMRVLHFYYQGRISGCSECNENCNDTECEKFYIHRHPRIFSHRFVEIFSTNINLFSPPPWLTPVENHASFLAKTDALPEYLRKIHDVMYEDAHRVGIWVNPVYDMFADAIVYAKGTWKSHKRLIFWNSGEMMVRLTKVFDKHPEKIAELDAYFPDILTKKSFHCSPCNPDCKYRIVYEFDSETKSLCGYSEFRFKNVTFEQAMYVWELFKMECNAKLVK